LPQSLFKKTCCSVRLVFLELAFGPKHSLNAQIADPLSIVASIVTLIEVSGATLSACYRFISKARRAPTEITKAINEVNGLKEILEALTALISSSESTPHTFLTILHGPSGPLETCTAILQEIQKQLEEMQDVSNMKTSSCGQ
jgi:hypothetical protein